MRALQDRGVSQRRACVIVGQPRRTLFYRSLPKRDGDLSDRIQRLAIERPRFGWRRLLIMFRREASIGEFRFRRLYKTLQLQVRARRKRKVRYVRGASIAAVTHANERWSVDFMHYRLGNGRSIRAMNVVDDFTRECLAVEVNYAFASAAMIRLLDPIRDERGTPATIRFDNVLPELSRDSRGKKRSAPGAPTWNAVISERPPRLVDPTMTITSTQGPKWALTVLNREFGPSGRPKHYLRGRERLNGP